MKKRPHPPVSPRMLPAKTLAAVIGGSTITITDGRVIGIRITSPETVNP